MRAPHLHDTLRRFCLGAFAVFTRELEDGAQLPFAFEEHGSYGRPTLYEYRPLVRGYVEARAERLFARVDVQEAVGDLLREPAARIFAHAHEGDVRDERRAVYRSVLVPLLVRTAEGCGGFDWDDSAFARAYEELEGSLYGEGHSYGAVAPLVGLSVGTQIELGDGIRVRVAATGELAAMWPQAAGLVLFERLDWRPYGIRPVLAIAATAPPGEPTRLDPFRASVASDVRVRLGAADEDPHLGDALDRWELALFQSEPFRGEQLRHALESALGEGDGAWAAAMRGAALLGATPAERADLAEKLREPSCELLRRLLVAILLHGDRRALVSDLDEALLGVTGAVASLQQRAS